MSVCTARWFGICCSREGDVSVGGVSVVTGVEQGIPLGDHHMLLTLTSCRELVLFSGDRRVSCAGCCPENALVLKTACYREVDSIDNAFHHFGGILVDHSFFYNQ